MGLLSSLFGSNKKSSTTSNTQQTTNNVTQPIQSGEIDGTNIQGSNNTVNLVDGGFLDAAERLASSTMDQNAYNLETVTKSLNSANDRAFDVADYSILGNQSITELALMNGADQTNTLASYLGEASQNNANIASDAMFNTVSSAEKALNFGRDSLDANSGLISQFGSDLKGAFDGVASLAGDFGFNLSSITSDSLASNERLASDFGSNLSSITSDSLASNERLASDFGSRLTDVTNSSFMFADNQNAYLASTLESNSQTLANSLTEMAVLQERGLDNALSVAGSISMDDAAEASTNMVKYLMLGLSAVGVAMAFRN